MFRKSRGPCQGAVPAQYEEGLNIFLLKNLDGFELGRLLKKLETTAGGKNRARIPDPTTDFDYAQWHKFTVEDALVAVLNSDNFDAKIDGGTRDRADRGIHSRGIAS